MIADLAADLPGGGNIYPCWQRLRIDSLRREVVALVLTDRQSCILRNSVIWNKVKAEQIEAKLPKSTLLRVGGPVPVPEIVEIEAEDES
jgi:hypothetical protein